MLFKPLRMKASCRYAIAGTLLLLVGGIMIWKRTTDSSHGVRFDYEDRRPLIFSTEPSPTTSKDSKADHGDDGPQWQRTPEIRSPGQAPAPDDAQVRIGFVQKSQDGRSLRIAIQRTPEEHEVLDVQKIQVRLDSLESPEQEDSANAEGIGVQWDTQGRDFLGAAAPRLLVNSEKPIRYVRISLTYDGRELERRVFSVLGKEK